MPLGLPAVEAQHLLDVLNALGWCEAAGFGAAPLRCTELLAWASGTRRHLAEWEFRALRAASAAYCDAALNKDAPEPALQALDPAERPAKAGLGAALAAALNGTRKQPTEPAHEDQ